MSDMSVSSDSDDVEPIELHPQSDSGDALQEAQALAKANEARLRKVSSAYKQLQGEMQALRDRHARDRDQEKRLITAKVVKSLFEPLQNLRRSVEAIEKAGVADELLSGIQMVGRNFMGAFEEMGLEKVPGVGASFDPDLHEALSVIPVPQQAADGRVVQVFSEGYRVGETLIEPAKVIIGKYTPPPESDESGEE